MTSNCALRDTLCGKVKITKRLKTIIEDHLRRDSENGNSREGL